MNYYSSLKIFHHKEVIDTMRCGHRPKPVYVRLILTNRCNQSCNFCVHRMKEYSASQTFIPSNQIPNHRALQLIDEIADSGTKAVELTGGGEPTIHPVFNKVCEKLQDYQIDYGVVTNGSTWDQDTIISLLKASWVRISIDCANSKTYSKIRNIPAKEYDRVRDNLRKLINTRSSKDPIIGVSFVVTEENWREIHQAALNAQSDGADNFRISAMFQNNGSEYFSKFYNNVQNICQTTMQLQSDTFKIFNMFDERLEDLKQKSPSYSFCPIQYLVPYIGADLNVYRCCILAYNTRGLLGSIAEQSFNNLWYSKEIEKLLSDFDARNCPLCMFNEKNNIIRYALEHAPKHVNFL